MEKIGKDNLAEVQSINVGDVLFVRLCDINCFSLEKEGEETWLTYDYYPQGEELKTPINENMLVAVKYLDNGIFEEMLTGEKFISGGYYDQKNDVYVNGENVPEVENYYSPVEYEVYEREMYSDSDLATYKSYITNCEEFKNISKNHPLLVIYDQSLDSDIDGFAHLIEINDQSKEEYIKYSDEQRKEVIKNLKHIAEQHYKEACARIDSEISKTKEQYFKEAEEIAYLDKNLYDFEQKKPTR